MKPDQSNNFGITVHLITCLVTKIWRNGELLIVKLLFTNFVGKLKKISSNKVIFIYFILSYMNDHSNLYVDNPCVCVCICAYVCGCARTRLGVCVSSCFTWNSKVIKYKIIT